MGWIDPSRARELAGHCVSPPQTIVLATGEDRLSESLPIPPRILPVDEGSIVNVYEWYHEVNGELIVIQEEVAPAKRVGTATFITPFVTGNVRGSDWMVLKKLEGISKEIRPTRPVFIENRSNAKRFALYRENVRGWEDEVYATDSREDALSLKDYLRHDAFNKLCVVREIDSIGEWVITTVEQSGIVELGGYPNRGSALRIACEMSSEKIGEVFYVSSGIGSAMIERFEIRDGSVRHGMKR